MTKKQAVDEILTSETTMHRDGTCHCDELPNDHDCGPGSDQHCVHGEIGEDDIADLSAAAAVAGDLAQVAICDRALGQLSSASRIADGDAIRRALEMTVNDAREECARVVAEAR